MKKTGGECVVEVLQKEGVKKVFGVPGESYLYVLDALYNHPQIDYISTRHEGGASFMAEGYAKASGKVGVCMATRGPGATNLSIGIHTAQQDSTPLVALIGQVERPFKDREAFQEIDYVPFFSHLCKWTVEIDRADRVPELLHRAFHIARSGRPGPVLVSLPEDMLEDFVDSCEAERSYAVNKIQPSDEIVSEVAKELEKAKNPVIIAGGGVIQSKATHELVELAEKTAVPVTTAFRRFTAFPNSHSNYIGSLGMGVPSYLVEFLQECDLVVAIGTRFSQLSTKNYSLPGKGARIIHVDISPDIIGKVYTPYIPVVSDAKEFLEKLLKVVEQNEDEQRANSLIELNDRYRHFSALKANYSDEDVNMDGVMYDIKQVIPEDSIITSDAGNFFTWLSRYYKFNHEDTYIGPTSGAMGYGLPSAIGAKVAKPERTVISFSGDGGMMMTFQEFETAVRNNIPIISIVINNGIYGTIRAHQEREFPTRVIGTDLSQPNFAQMAQNMGGYGERVETNADFKAVLERSLSLDKPVLIEVITNPNILSAK